MGLLSKLKSVFGFGGTERSGSSSDAEVTVEYAPDAETEHAVKGTDEALESDDAEADEALESDDAEADEAGDTPEGPAVDEVKGIGQTYSGRLGTAGIETVGDLADTDAEAVAEAAEVSVSRAENWIERARSRT